MKKAVLFLLLVLTITLVFAGTPRSYYQRCVRNNGTETLVTNTGATTSPNYALKAVLLRTGDVLGIGYPTSATSTKLLSSPPTTIRLSRMGTAPNQYTAFLVQLGSFPSQWLNGDIVRCYVKYLLTNEEKIWDMTIPPGVATINNQNPGIVIPPPAKTMLH